AENFVNDGMATLATCLAMTMDTRRITVRADIANVYLRHPATLGAAAVAIDELCDGRFILGLGVNRERFVTGARPHRGGTAAEVARHDRCAAHRALGRDLPGIHL